MRFNCSFVFRFDKLLIFIFLCYIFIVDFDIEVLDNLGNCF